MSLGYVQDLFPLTVAPFLDQFSTNGSENCDGKTQFGIHKTQIGIHKTEFGETKIGFGRFVRIVVNRFCTSSNSVLCFAKLSFNFAHFDFRLCHIDLIKV